MIKSTKNYGIFKKHDSNREMVEGNVQKIMKSIQIKNLLEYRPVLVDSEMRVIDGQHRLEAAKRLEIPIFFEIKEDVEPEDIILLNDNSKNWSREDYLNFYCSQGNKEYLKMKAFIEKHKIPLATAIAVMGLDSGKDMSKRAGGTPFKRGKFVFPAAHEEIESVNILHQSQEVIDLLTQKIPGGRGYLKGPKFRRALYNFLSIKAVEFDIFMNKLNHKLDLMRPCSRITDFMNLFKQIYNWRNKDPVNIEDVC